MNASTGRPTNKLVFWEKPGCQGNRRQQRWLREQGFEVDIRDLLQQPWTARELRPFFGDKALKHWFNDSAPAVRAGNTDLACVDADVALLLMVNDPILIRRPLLQLGDLKQSGFEPGPVLDALGIVLDDERDLQACPRPQAAMPCELPT
jgi:nitrogenase-associated protein